MTTREPAGGGTAIPLLPMLMLALAPLCALAAPATLDVSYPGRDGQSWTVSYASPDAGAPLRSYTQASSMPLRPTPAGAPPQQLAYSEAPGLPRVRSGNLGFDALFALAGVEMRQDSVAEIRDGSYNGGQPIACDCFETGEQWHYVWTRDLSYGAALGLAPLDPLRVRNSLLFKLSGYRAGAVPGSGSSSSFGSGSGTHVAGSADGLQIIQDTGSGGSWPVSTDRVSWAFGAAETLKALAPAERAAFAVTALKALANTIANDRLAAFDAATGLYNGEQSFLDWREQSYAGWIAGDLSSMASSQALSTNAAHYQALMLAAQLAREQGQTADSARYAGWAADLKRAINARLWQPEAGLYSSLSAGHFDAAPLHKYDWLGQALAIVTGIADQDQARTILRQYPHGPLGPPVIFPQQPDQPVYHNRAMWPFVTAYGLRAAIIGDNVSVADAAYDSLMRGAALNLSNMENLEWLTGQALLQDQRHPALSGPVINSRRQLWSVGAYLGMVINGVFGVSTTDDGIALRPFVTSRLRREAFGASERISLEQLDLRGKRLRVTLLLPPAAPAASIGYYAMQSITLNGRPAGAALPWTSLEADNAIEIQLGALLPGQQGKHDVDAAPLLQDPRVYAPHEPEITGLVRGTYGLPTLTIAGVNGNSVRYNVYRNGRQVAANLSANADGGATWAERHAGTGLVGEMRGACYAVEAVYPGFGNRSHHSAPACLDAPADIGVGDARVTSNIAASQGAAFLPNWGAPSDRFAVRGIRLAQNGAYRFQLSYRNTANQVNLGISGGVKWLALKDQQGRVVAQGVVQLPHSQPGKTVQSTPLVATVARGSYRLELSDFYNMSYLQSNTSFSAAGGVAGPSNRFDLYGVRISAAPAAPAGAGSADVTADAARGTLRIIDGVASPQLGNSRALRIYLPPGYDAQPKRRYPVLYMHDGQNLFEAATAYHGNAWQLASTLDRLIGNGEMAPVIVVGIDNSGDRLAEYTPCCDPKYGGGKLDLYERYLLDTVKPTIDRTLRTLPGPAHTAIMGSSLGGIASVHIAQRHPEVFGAAGSMSGSFWWNGKALTTPPPGKLPVRFYLDAGSAQDGLEDTLRMRDALRAQGYRDGRELYFVEDPGGSHNEQSWAARVHVPLTWMFPPMPAK